MRPSDDFTERNKAATQFLELKTEVQKGVGVDYKALESKLMALKTTLSGLRDNENYLKAIEPVRKIIQDDLKRPAQDRDTALAGFEKAKQNVPQLEQAMDLVNNPGNRLIGKSYDSIRPELENFMRSELQVRGEISGNRIQGVLRDEKISQRIREQFKDQIEAQKQALEARERPVAILMQHVRAPFAGLEVWMGPLIKEQQKAATRKSQEVDSKEIEQWLKTIPSEIPYTKYLFDKKEDEEKQRLSATALAIARMYPNQEEFKKDFKAILTNANNKEVVKNFMENPRGYKEDLDKALKHPIAARECKSGTINTLIDRFKNVTNKNIDEKVYNYKTRQGKTEANLDFRFMMDEMMRKGDKDHRINNSDLGVLYYLTYKLASLHGEYEGSNPKKQQAYNELEKRLHDIIVQYPQKSVEQIYNEAKACLRDAYTNKQGTFYKAANKESDDFIQSAKKMHEREGDLGMDFQKFQSKVLALFNKSPGMEARESVDREGPKMGM